MKTTAIAPSNIAFTKYWGRKDEKLRLPANGSISMCLSNLLTTTTVEFRDDLKKDDITINNQKNEKSATRVSEHLDRIRKLAGINTFAKVVSENNFPTATGLSSSASGFAALTVAGAKAAGLNLSKKELSILARQGSGSACRSIPDGFVEWQDGDTSQTSFAKSIFPPDYWDIVDVVVVVSNKPKETPTSDAQKLAYTSPLFAKRVAGMKKKNEMLKQYIKTRNFLEFGKLLQDECLELHAVYGSQIPQLVYLTPQSQLIMKKVMEWQNAGFAAYFTVNTGQDVHLIAEKKNLKELQRKLKDIMEIKQTIVNFPAHGTHLMQTHLF